MRGDVLILVLSAVVLTSLIMLSQRVDSQDRRLASMASNLVDAKVELETQRMESWALVESLSAALEPTRCTWEMVPSDLRTKLLDTVSVRCRKEPCFIALEPSRFINTEL